MTHTQAHAAALRIIAADDGHADAADEIDAVDAIEVAHAYVRSHRPGAVAAAERDGLWRGFVAGAGIGVMVAALMLVWGGVL